MTHGRANRNEVNGTLENVSTTELVQNGMESRDIPQISDDEEISHAFMAVNSDEFKEYIGKHMGKKNHEKDILDSIKDISFADSVKIDFICPIWDRIMCRFLKVMSIDEIDSFHFTDVKMTSFLLMSNLEEFMKTKEMELVGELRFNSNGMAVPVEKQIWELKNGKKDFIIDGYLYFKHKSDTSKNIVIHNYSDFHNNNATITCKTTDKKYAQKIISDLDKYTQDKNCLKGSNIQDITITIGSLSCIDIEKKYNWDNYYYPKNIKDLFKKEVFDFLKNPKKYNKLGIYKRGILCHGRPGTGKTTIGNIICNMMPDNTVLWITPEMIAQNNQQSNCSFKNLYKVVKYISPCVIILEDLDLFSQDRAMGSGNLTLGSLMNILDGVNSVKNAVTIGTTNRIDTIESALRNRPGRFDRVIEIPRLNSDLREKMISERIEKWEKEEDIITYIVKNTDDWTGAELQELINTINLQCVDKKEKIINKELVDEVLEIMKNFGVGENSSFGF